MAGIEKKTRQERTEIKKEEKKQIRREMIKKRNALSKREQEDFAKRCTKQLISMSEFKEAKVILVYMSYNGEMMTDYIIEEARRQKKIVAAPTVLGKEMEFYQFEKKEELVKDRHGILEPIPCEEKQVFHRVNTTKAVDMEIDMEDMEKDTLLIMPGVAFDVQRNRVGYGGGFYDRYVQKHQNLKKIAIAYQFQVIESVPAEAFDERPDWIVTEKGIV